MHNAPKDIKIILGFDFGLKHIGVAIGEIMTATVKPLSAITARHGNPKWEDIDHLVERWEPNAFVVGVPINMDGTDGSITHLAKKFALALFEHYSKPVYEVDERLTTVEAKQQLFQKGGFDALDKSLVDSYAAKIIVESWIADKQRKTL